MDTIPINNNQTDTIPINNNQTHTIPINNNQTDTIPINNNLSDKYIYINKLNLSGKYVFRRNLYAYNTIINSIVIGWNFSSADYLSLRNSNTANKYYYKIFGTEYEINYYINFMLYLLLIFDLLNICVMIIDLLLLIPMFGIYQIINYIGDGES